MISNSTSPVSWVLLIDELVEAAQHLQSLADEMSAEGVIDEAEYSVRVGHVYAHLNRAWNTRRVEDGAQELGWELASGFPSDIEPVG